jgi:hypothetical protein
MVSRFKLKARASATGSSHYQTLVAVGIPPTAGALAYYIPESNTAWLFCEESPWQKNVLKVFSMNNLIEVAQKEHKQALKSIGNC